MIIVAGVLIALAIGLTGVGAGIITAPLLISVFHVPPAEAVGTALVFGAVTKVCIAPAYALRRQIDYRALLVMLAGGIPGVLAGSVILAHLDVSKHQSLISLVLGITIIVFAGFSLVRVFFPAPPEGRRERRWLLGAFALPIGAEVGFSSAGSGSLASLTLFAFTKLAPAAVVGTDVAFGLGLSLVGGGVLFSSGHTDAAILPGLLAGGVAGAIAAPFVAQRVPQQPLRIGLLLWIAFLGTTLVDKGLAH
jgi:uncharacterized membrane protein YfcA